MQLPYLEKQLHFLVELTKYRNDFFDPIFLFLNYFDTPYFSIFVIPLVWFGFSYRWGLKVTSLFFVTTFSNSLLKLFFALPRPTVAMPEIGMLLMKSYGFPSGGAQTSFLLGSLLMYYYRNIYAYLLGTFYILLISFSRLYLGVHYPLDILGGWIAALILFFAFIKMEKKLDSFIDRKQDFIPYLLLISGVVSVYLIRIFPFTGGALFLFIGAWIGIKYRIYQKTPKTFWMKIAKGSLAGGLGLTFTFLVPSTLSIAVKSSLLGLWMSLGIGFVFNLLKSFKQKR